MKSPLASLPYVLCLAAALGLTAKLAADVDALEAKVAGLESRSAELSADNLKLRDELWLRKLLSLANRALTTNATAYCASADGFTATMTRPRPGRTLAVSRDLKGLLGRKVYVAGHGVWRVEDLMDEDIRRTVDFYVGSESEAREFGRKKVRLYVVN